MIDEAIENDPLQTDSIRKSTSLKSEDRRRKSFLQKLIFHDEFNSCCAFLITTVSMYLIYLSVFDKNFTDPLYVEIKESNFTMYRYPQVITTSTFTLFCIIVLGIISAHIAQKVNLPGLLGMILVGIALRNLVDDIFFVLPSWSVTLRRAAFVVILLRGGLSLDADALKKLKGACLRLCFIPCSVEAIVVASAAKLFLNMDYMYGLLLGFVLAAVSPAVIVPAMVDAQNHCYGTDSGVPTLIVAAASLDDVYAITMFSILLSIVFSTGDSIQFTLIKAPVEVLSGIFFGAVCGFVLRYIPGPKQKNKNLIRFCMLFSMSLAWLFATISLKVDSIGAIAVLVTAFVAGISWKKEGSLPTEGQLSLAWKLLFEPCLFGLIGFELSFDIVSWTVIGWGSLVLVCGLLFRTVAAFVAVFGAGFNMREKLFVAISWLPKATVQAALAPLALDIARSRLDLPAVYTDNGVIVFTIAVLSILTTAPIGAFIIRMCTPILLKKVYPKASIELG